MSTRWIRQGGALVVVHRDVLLVLGPGGKVLRFEEASADLVRTALEFFSAAEARGGTEDELLAHLRELAGECDPSLVSQTTACLRDAGVLRAVDGAASAGATDEAAKGVGPARAHVVVGVSGAIAATDVPSLVRRLQARRFDVTVAMTRAARRFVSAASLGAITHRSVVTGFWRRPEAGPAPHIQLSTSADLIVVYPATAATLARIACGACSDVVSATVVASRGPVLVVPSMNDAMLRSAAVQRNIEQLRLDGRFVALPGMGHEVAVRPAERTPIVGAAAPPSQIAAAAEVLLADRLAARASAPATAEAWDRHYETTPLTELPWFVPELDADLATAIRAVGRGRLLDVGTGPGTAAIFAARCGFDVVATDLSRVALAAAEARARASNVSVTWIRDDATQSSVSGRFDVVVDRGCLHCLPKALWPRYAASAARWLAPGGQLLIKIHAASQEAERARLGTHPASETELRALFADAFTLDGAAPSVFEGTTQPPPGALLARLTRRA